MSEDEVGSNVVDEVMSYGEIDPVVFEVAHAEGVVGFDRREDVCRTDAAAEEDFGSAKRTGREDDFAQSGGVRVGEIRGFGISAALDVEDLGGDSSGCWGRSIRVLNLDTVDYTTATNHSADLGVEEKLEVFSFG